jgi:hypothetical protein
MEINKAWRHDSTFGIDGLRSRLGDVANCHNAAIADTDIGTKTFTTGPINDHAARNHQIKH